MAATPMLKAPLGFLQMSKQAVAQEQERLILGLLGAHPPRCCGDLPLSAPFGSISCLPTLWSCCSPSAGTPSAEGSAAALAAVCCEPNPKHARH